MTQEPISVNNNPPVSGEDGLPPLEIWDDTPEDVVAVEQAVFSGVAPDEVPRAETDNPPGAAPIVEEGVEEGVIPPLAAEQVPPVPVETEEARISRLIDERTRGLQSAMDKRVADAEASAKRAEDKNQEFNLAAQVEAELQRQQLSLAEEIGEDAAARHVRTEQNISGIKAGVTAQAQNAVLQSQITEQAMGSRANLMSQWLNIVTEENSLTDAAHEALRGMVTRESLNDNEAFHSIGMAIQKMAVQLGTSRGQANRNMVPPETPGATPGSGRSTPTAPSGQDALLRSAEEKQPWQWTQAEHDAMRDVAHGGMR